MIMKKIVVIALIFALILSISCKKEGKWKGQEPIKRVETINKPIQKQWKGIFEIDGNVYVTNDFNGARLNGIVRVNDTLISALITPENTPINESPWYAFKIWADREEETYIKLTYPQGMNHRYNPKISLDGNNWTPVDSANFKTGKYKDSKSESKSADFITIKTTIGPDTLWISAQELIASNKNSTWIKVLSENSFVSTQVIGKSKEGRNIEMMKIGEGSDNKMIAILSRQHPPELTGYLCMKSFAETLCGDSELAKKFRQEYNTYVIPMLNPDGVDNGHWRHNSGGIDLNRDWESHNQTETQLVDVFFKNKVTESEGKIFIAMDFHSTFQDIYYTIDPALSGNLPGIIPEIINKSASNLPNYVPNIRPNTGDNPVSSLFYFFNEFGAESVVVELGDNTPRDFLKLKGEKLAEAMMELLLKYNK